jgi:hypothetical protein
MSSQAEIKGQIQAQMRRAPSAQVMGIDYRKDGPGARAKYSGTAFPKGVTGRESAGKLAGLVFAGMPLAVLVKAARASQLGRWEKAYDLIRPFTPTTPRAVGPSRRKPKAKKLPEAARRRTPTPAPAATTPPPPAATTPPPPPSPPKKRRKTPPASSAARLMDCEEQALAAMLEHGAVTEAVAESLWPEDEGAGALDYLARRGIISTVGDKVIPGDRMAEAKRPRERLAPPEWLTGIECWAECGTWKSPSKAELREGWPVGFLAGPRATMWDSHGRSYVVRYAVDTQDQAMTSHGAKTGKATLGYPAALQPRDRSGAILRLQVEDLAAGFDPRRYLAPAYGPDTGTPVVLLQPARDGRSPGAPFVVAGNGRLMSMRRWSREEGHADRWRAVVMGRWKSRKLGDAVVVGGSRGELARGMPIVRVLQSVDGRAITMAAAVKLAGASQVSPSAETSAVAGAISEARGLGVASPLDVAPWRWSRPIDRASWPEFTRGAWHKAFLKLLSRAQRAAASSSDTGPGKVEALLLGTLPADALPPDAAPPGSLEALAGALPAIWLLEQERIDGNVSPEWSLIPYLPAAWTWVVRAGTRGAARAIALAEDDNRQMQALPDASYDDHGIRAEGIALAVILLRAAKRLNPRKAAGELLAPVLAAAASEPPNQATLIPSPPVAPRLLRLAGVRWSGAEDNPGAPLTIYGRSVTLTIDPRDTRRRTPLQLPPWLGLAHFDGRSVMVNLEAGGPGSELAKVAGARGELVTVAELAPPALDGEPDRVRVVAVEYMSTGSKTTRRRHRVTGRVYYYPQTGALTGLRATRSR